MSSSPKSIWKGLVVSSVAAIGLACLSGCFGGGVKNVPQAGPELVPGGVVFRYFDSKASHVNVVGDFNGWSPRADALVDENGDGLWTLFFDLSPGTYQYKFIVDGVHWIPDPKNPERVSDGFEGENSVLHVPPR